MMSDKIKLQLRPSELIALTKHLAATLVSIPKEQIITDPANFLVLSALQELYAKVKPKAEDIRIFPKRRTDDTYNVTITRTQALALCCVGFNEPETTQAVESYESAFIKRLVGNIHQTFLV